MTLYDALEKILKNMFFFLFAIHQKKIRCDPIASLTWLYHFGSLLLFLLRSISYLTFLSSGNSVTYTRLWRISFLFRLNLINLCSFIILTNAFLPQSTSDGPPIAWSWAAWRHRNVERWPDWAMATWFVWDWDPTAPCVLQRMQENLHKTPRRGIGGCVGQSGQSDRR